MEKISVKLADSRRNAFATKVEVERGTTVYDFISNVLGEDPSELTVNLSVNGVPVTAEQQLQLGDVVALTGKDNKGAM